MALSMASEPLGSLSSFNGNYVNTATSSAFTLGTGDFTIEYWVYMTNVTGTKRFFGNVTAADNAGFNMDTNGTQISIGSWATNTYYTPTPSLTAVFLNQWVHVAWVRISGVEYLYLNGTLLASVTRSINFTGTGGVYLGVAGVFNTNNGMVGNLSNFRIVKGVGVYTGNFTPPVQPLLGTQSAGTNISAVTGTQTSLLVQTPNNANFLKDSSANNFTFTNTGPVTTSSLTPFLTSNTVTWQIISNPLGSVSFNGTSQYLNNTTALTTFTFGSGDFTVEYWVYYNSLQAAYQHIAGPSTLSTTGFAFGIYGDVTGVNGSGRLYLTTSAVSYFTDRTIGTNQWYHVAFVRTSGTLVAYANGVGSTAIAAAVNCTDTGISIGALPTLGSYYSNAYVSNLRVTKGVAVYTANFVVPTQPLLGQQSTGTNISAITGTQTSLLLQTPNNAAFITDSSANNITLTNNGTTPAAALNPFDFAPKGSVNFNGTSQSLTTTGTTSGALDLATGAGNWTVECWVNPNSVTGQQSIFWKGGTSGSINPSYAFFLNGTGGQWLVGDGSGGAAGIQNVSFTFAIGQWYHFALVRNGSTFTAYINGVGQTPITISGTMGNTTNNNLSIGSSSADGSTRYFAGYISNFRITKGVAVYTGNFTPPAQPLAISQNAGTNISAVTGTQTSLLLRTPNSAGFIADSSSYNFTMTNNNTATASGVTPFGVVPAFSWQLTS